VNKNIRKPISNPGEVADPVTAAQEASLNSLLGNDRLNRLQVNVERFGADKAYSAIEMLNDVQSGIFSELANKKAIDMYRRGLQKLYVEKLSNILNPPAASGLTISFGAAAAPSFNLSRSDLPAIARAQLIRLRTQINVAIPATTDSMSKIHLQDLAERIRLALDPNK